MVVDGSFDWEGDVQLGRPWAETSIYELHVKGFTKQLEGVREDLRGTYAGLASEAALEYLRELGVTAVELLPVHHIADEHALVERGLTNYWGYSTIGYFAPHAGYAATGSRGEQVREFKGMVKALHRAGIEVILDVVYNHTAEGNHLGPTLSFKGVDNAAYYRLVPDDPRHYMDFTGTGNSLNPVNPSVLRLIMDSLRYFVTECHVDGFRFDLASALARELYDVDRLSAFFDVIHQDPVLSQVEADRRAVGRRARRLPGRELPGALVGVERDVPRLGARLLARARRRRGVRDAASPGRATCTRTTVATRPRRSTSSPRTTGSRCATSSPYDHKHNEANGEGNRDGTDDNRSWNCGVEGETDDPEVNALRDRQSRNILATLLLSQGTPMLLAGDEFRNTQGGNNNAYCQDNELSWLDWEVDERAGVLVAFTKRLLRLRAEHPVFRRSAFLTGEERQGSGAPDVWWFRPDGRKMTQADWSRGDAFALGAFLNGAEIPTLAPDGEPVADESFIVLFNAWREPVTFVLPPARFGRRWAHRAVHRRAGDRAERRDLPGPRAPSRSRRAPSASSAASAEASSRPAAACAARGGRSRRPSGRTAFPRPPRGGGTPPRR